MALNEIMDLSPEEIRLVIAALFRSCELQLDDTDFGFAPLLPDVEQPVSVRTEALLQWCQGFIGGLGLGGFRDERMLSKDGREVLRDLVEISRTPVSLDEDEEVDEAALAELTEFARVGAVIA